MFYFSLQSAWSAFWRDRKSDTIFVLIPIFGVGMAVVVPGGRSGSSFMFKLFGVGTTGRGLFGLAIWRLLSVGHSE